MKKILAIVATLALLTGFSYAWASSQPIGGQTYYLAGAGVTSSQTTIQLSSFKTPDGRNVTMTMIGTLGYGALEPQTTSKIEDVTFTGITQNANGTATLTGVSRGMDFVYPYTASTTLQKSHAGGAVFVITNTAGFYYNEFTMQNNNNLNTWPTASSSPASKGYVDNVAFNGAAVINADTGNRGVVQIGTAAQAAASAGLGGTSASLVVPTSIATSTYNSNTAASVIPVTGAGKILDPKFIFNGQSLTFPASTGASSTVLMNDGTGATTWNTGFSTTINPAFTPVSVSTNASTTLLSFTVPANTIGTRNTLRVRVYGSENMNSGTFVLFDASLGGTSSTTLKITAANNNQVNDNEGYVEFTIQGNGTTNSQNAMFLGLQSAINSSTTTMRFATSTPAIDTTVAQRLLMVASTSDATGPAFGNIKTYFATAELLR